MDGHIILIQTGVPLRMIRGTIKYQIEETGVAVLSKPGHMVTQHRLCLLTSDLTVLARLVTLFPARFTLKQYSKDYFMTFCKARVGNWFFLMHQL